jgi:hypothetical protein
MVVACTPGASISTGFTPTEDNRLQKDALGLFRVKLTSIYFLTRFPAGTANRSGKRLKNCAGAPERTIAASE